MHSLGLLIFSSFLYHAWAIWPDFLQLTNAGFIKIHSTCSSTIYLKETGEKDSPVRNLSIGSSMSYSLQELPFGGSSINFSTSWEDLHAGKNQLQWAYTINSQTNQTFQEFPSIDLDSTSTVVQGGFSATNSNADGFACRNRICQPHQINCRDSYQNPDENRAISTCPVGSNTTIRLCLASGSDGD